MRMHIDIHPRNSAKRALQDDSKPLGQTVLVLQGGGALGAYQAGVYQAMHEAGVEPDWVVGTSIGAINGALIAGNHPQKRLVKLKEFWDRVECDRDLPWSAWWGTLGNAVGNLNTVLRGVPSFFAPNPSAAWGAYADVGIESAAYYTTDLLRGTLSELLDFEYLAGKYTRLTVGAVNANSGAMRYFDSRTQTVSVEHILASGALPPAFAAVRIDGEPYWDGGIYSNTPIEVVLDDNPRRDSTIFAVQLWNPRGAEPTSLWGIQTRQKDIQFSSRANSHIENQQKLHKLRHIIRELQQYVPAAERQIAQVKELASWGCGTTMHVLRLVAPRIAGEDHTKDIDFTGRAIRARWQAGYQDTRNAISQAPWQQKVNSTEGIVVHDFESSPQ